MGRPGVGGGGGGHSFGGHGGRSSGGHSFGGRPGRSSSSSHSYGSSHSYHHYHHYGGNYRTYSYSSEYSPLAIILAVIIMICVGVVSLIGMLNHGDYGKSTIAREKISVNASFDTHCIHDETGWIENESALRTAMEDFFDTTGVQPYVVLVNPIDGVDTNEEKEEYANKWYEENIDNEGTFLYMYFSEGEHSDIVGYMAYVCGKGITEFVDQEAIDIFWNIIDYQWTRDITMDEVFASTFDAWGERCMKTTHSDMFYIILVAVGVVVFIVFIISIIVIIDKRAKRAQANAQILNSSIDDLSNAAAEDVANKYD